MRQNARAFSGSPSPTATNATPASSSLGSSGRSFWANSKLERSPKWVMRATTARCSRCHASVRVVGAASVTRSTVDVESVDHSGATSAGGDDGWLVACTATWCDGRVARFLYRRQRGMRARVFLGGHPRGRAAWNCIAIHDLCSDGVLIVGAWQQGFCYEQNLCSNTHASVQSSVQPSTIHTPIMVATRQKRTPQTMH